VFATIQSPDEIDENLSSLNDIDQWMMRNSINASGKQSEIAH
jgi:hypothetical protein